jgi:predicted nucleotidyltransferase
MDYKGELENFVDDLRNTHGSNLVSIILYGSAATGDYHKDISDYNLLVVLNRIAPEDLKQAYAATREWRKLGQPTPVYLTLLEIEQSTDIFPIEFYSMKKAYVVLFGDDVLKNLQLSDENLRHQIEYELRSKLMRLRKNYMHSYGSARRIAELMIKSISSFVTLFNAALILRKCNTPVKKREIIEMASKEFNISKEPFLKILRLREEGVSNHNDETEIDRLFTEYMLEIERFIQDIDAFLSNLK